MYACLESEEMVGYIAPPRTSKNISHSVSHVASNNNTTSIIFIVYFVQLYKLLYIYLIDILCKYLLDILCIYGLECDVVLEARVPVKEARVKKQSHVAKSGYRVIA